MVPDADVSMLNASINAGYQVAAGLGAAVSSTLFGLSSSFWLDAGCAALSFCCAAALFAVPVPVAAGSGARQTRMAEKRRGNRS